MSEARGRKILTFKTKNEISGFVLKRWAELSRKEIRRKRRFVVALSGGRTPVELYRCLADSGDVLPWEKIHLFLADERFVSPDDPDSNYGIIRENLLRHISLPHENVHPIKILGTPSISARRYEREIETFFHLKKGAWPRFDLIILGIGEDGHTASLFPNHPALTEDGHLAVPVRLDETEHDRISLTLPVINRAKAVFFLVAGKHKAEIIKKILEGRQVGLPASLVKPTRGEVLFLLDRGASSLLSKNLNVFAYKTGWRGACQE